MVPAGQDPALYPTGPASVQVDRAIVQSGGFALTFEVYLEGTDPTNVRGYQFALDDAIGGSAGSVDYDPSVPPVLNDVRADYIFIGAAGTTLTSVDEGAPARVVGAVAELSDTVAASDPVYLGEITYGFSSDASGTFSIDFIDPGTTPGESKTIFADDSSAPITFTADGAVIQIIGESIPTVSTWGMISMTIILLAAGTLVLRRTGKRVGPVAACVLIVLMLGIFDDLIACTFDSDCDDAIACTVDVCNMGVCENTPNNALCDDGIFCNGAEICAGGFCQSPGDPCGGLACDEVGDQCLCNVDADCDDANPCTDDFCVLGNCENEPGFEGFPCDDGLFCTSLDLCEGGTCEGTSDTCLPEETCDEANDLCLPAGETGCLVYGDINKDAVVDLFDVLLALDEFVAGTAGPADIRPCGGDGVVDELDVDAMGEAFAGDYLCAVECLEPGLEPGTWATPFAALEGSPRAGDSNPLYGLYGFNGEFHMEAADLAVRGRGFDFVWGRKYRSRYGPDTAQGNGWDYSYNIRLEPDGADLRLNDGNTRQDRYELQTDGTWTRRGFFRVVEQNPDNTFTSTFANKGKWNFHALDGSVVEGKIYAIVDRNENTMEFEYDGSGRLVAIHDTLDTLAHNRDITITYDGDDRIEAVCDWTGRCVILVIDNYDSFVYNLVQYLGELGVELAVVRNDEVTVEAVRELGPASILLSPGPGTPDDLGICLDVVKRLSGSIPILGVCLGHQVIGQAFGGSVIRADCVVHGKTSLIHHDGLGMLEGLAQPFAATRYHSLIVSREGLPESLTVSAWTGDGLIMGLRHRSLPLEGVQFHPESILTEEGRKLMANFVRRPIGCVADTAL
jgi:anthranilate synthase/aminodeoxychorismate synthase-like glutamine amidotransferase